MQVNEEKCLLGIGTSEFEDRKSIFYGIAFPVSSESEVKSKLESVKKKYSDANHHVYAYILKDNHLCRYTDDSEPQGTAGLPILTYIQSQNLTDILVVVTRYFGGTLLGTGGLTRAYGTAAKAAVENGGIGILVPYSFVSMKLSYSDYQKVYFNLSRMEAEEDNVRFEVDVTLTVLIETEKTEHFIKQILELTNGRCKYEIVRTKLVPKKSILY